MLTWAFWHALRHPPARNPLFRRAYTAPEQPIPWYIGCVQGFGILLFLPILAFAGLIYSIGWSVGIANLIGKERVRGTFDLLSLCPSGPLGMSWAIATGYLYHHRTFKNITSPGNVFIRVMLAGSLIALVDLQALLAPGVDWTILLWTLLSRLAAAAVALYIDQVQSLVLGALVGMVMPGIARERVNAQLYAFAAYIGAQLATYFVTIMVGFYLIPLLFDRLSLAGIGADAVIVLLRLALFFGTRELLIRLLWRRLVEQLNPDPGEIRTLLRAHVGGFPRY